MSSLANAIKRKTHKERSQPAARQKYGLLEKHKDYVERAKDFHRKENFIKVLKRKAEERNPDEFYFAMEHARTKGGVHELSRSRKYTEQELALMRSQDAKYLTMKERVEAEKVRKLKESLHFIGAPAQSRHTVFVDSSAEAASFDPVEYFQTPAPLLDRAFNRPRAETLANPEAVVTGGKRLGKGASGAKADRRKLASYRELEQRLDRHAQLARTAQAAEYQKLVTGKERKRKLRADELGAPAGGQDADEDEEGDTKQRLYKWKRERKK